MPSYEEVTQRAGSLRSMTGLAAAEFMALLPHFERALLAYLQDRTIDGQPRTSRRYSTYETCPLPTMADKLLFHPDLFETEPHPRSAQAALWDVAIECEQVDAFAASGVESGPCGTKSCFPVRTAADLAAMLATRSTEAPSASPLLCMMGPNARSSVRKTLRTSKTTTAARRRATRSKTSC